MTDRRPLGTGPTRADPSRDTELVTTPRAGTAAQRLPVVPATDEPPPDFHPDGRRPLGTGATEH